MVMRAPIDIYFFRNIGRIMELTVVVSILFVSVSQKWFESTRKREGWEIFWLLLPILLLTTTNY